VNGSDTCYATHGECKVVTRRRPLVTGPARPGLAEVLAEVLDSHVGWQMHRGEMADDLAAVGEQWFTDRLAEVHGADLIAAERRRQIEVEVAALQDGDR
jgi:hypothetical protein